jgi:hypothetical protein
MVAALRSPSAPEHGRQDAFEPTHADDWLTLPQAACEMGVSVSTVRRLLRGGRLRNRVVPRRGGFKYLIYLPGNRHAAGGPLHLCESELDDDTRRARRGQEREIRDLEKQVASLSQALSRALRVRQKAVPMRAAAAAGNGDEPYARYRWLVRKRRWWPFD